MRSRYSAFALGLLDYLRDTWHPSTRPAAIEPLPAGLRWLGLDVRRHVQQDADHAIVEFVARSKLGGQAERLHETSRFVREGGRWFYVKGVHGAPRSLALPAPKGPSASGPAEPVPPLPRTSRQRRERQSRMS